jgi:hypothetical protein
MQTTSRILNIGFINDDHFGVGICTAIIMRLRLESCSEKNEQVSV